MAKSSTQQPLVWLLLGQKAGDNNQVLALADALGWPFERKHIVNQPWELLTNLALKVTLAGIKQASSSQLAPPWPDLVISAGRRNEPVARWIKQQSGGRTRLVHIGRPWAPLKCWDLIVTTPQYFLPANHNIVHNALPMHRVTPARLAAEGEKPWSWSTRQRPFIAVLLGGDSGSFVFTPDKARRLGTLVNDMALAMGGTVLVTDSRRTPEQAGTAFLSVLTAPVHCHSWRQGAEENPYLAYLALADALVVTGESMSMLAEAAATGKPLYIFDLGDFEAGNKKRPWWLYGHNLRWKPISHHLGMALGPRRMRRDIGRVQDYLVAGGGARWLHDWQQGVAAWQGAITAEFAQKDALVAAARIKGLFGEIVR